MVSLPMQCGTQWDALGHIFYDEKMWNGYDARLVDSTGAKKNGIHKARAGMIGRGILLDIPRFKGGDYLEDGYGIRPDEARSRARDQGLKSATIFIVPTGQMNIASRATEALMRRAMRGIASKPPVDTSQTNRRSASTWGCSAPERKHRSVSAVALDRDSDDRHLDGRNYLSAGSRRRLRARQG
jgi:hypothetical protein